MKNKIFLIILMFGTLFSWSQGLKTQGKKIVDQNGNEVILRGMGLGGWMLQEGYMMQSSDVADTQHEFKNRLIALMGETKTNEFYDAWLANHVTKKDIDSLAKWGFNSVRLPMHYNLFTLPIEDEQVAGGNTWLTKGFTMVDNLLDWCESNKMYLILDLHGAPGGQGTNAAISDYDDTKPSLWQSQENKNKTVALWRKLADRYKDEPWIGGYDLINEVNGNHVTGTQLKQFYVEITNAIREVDTKHILFIEGHDWANNFTGLTPAWDNNMVYSFHKYWSYNDLGSIQWVLNLRDQQNVPLWMGEAGENSNVWFTDAIKLFEDNNIGWSWWPLKRVETIVGPYSIPFTPAYKKILSYWRGETTKPTETEAYNAMMELAANSNSSKCYHQKDVPDAMIRQVKTNETKPYKKHNIPGVVYLSDFDLGKNGIAYYDIDVANYSGSSGEFQAWNSGWVYRNDGVDISTNVDNVNSNKYHIGYVRKGEWVSYTVNVAEASAYKAKVRLSTPNNGGVFHLSINGEDITAGQTVASTNGWTNFQTIEIPNIVLKQGAQVLKLHIDNAVEYNMSSIEFVKTGTVESVSCKALNGETGSDEKSVEISVSQTVLASSLTGSSGLFTLYVNGVSQPISSVSLKSNKEKTLVLATSKNLLYTDQILVSYSGDLVKSVGGKQLETFSNLVIRNTLAVVNILPLKIEAENYKSMVGLATETTTDIGGGKNISYTDANDYADYIIYSEEEQNYKVNFRVAGAFNAGSIGLFLVNESSVETSLLTVATPVTGGWQTWATVSGDLIIPKGKHTLRLKILAGGFNLNWMEFILQEKDSDKDGVADTKDVCPNTTNGAAVDSNGCFTLAKDNFEINSIGETCPNMNNGQITIKGKANYSYKTTINGINHSFIGNATIKFSNLTPKTYDFCISVVGESFEQCYSIEIAAGKTVSGKSTVANKKASIEILEGTAPFNVEVNGKLMLQTMSNTFEIPVQNGDFINVKTSVVCEGVFAKSVDLVEAVEVYPNPSKGIFEIGIPIQKNEVLIEVFNYNSQLVLSKIYPVQYGQVIIDLSNNSNGVYLAKIHLDTLVNIKIIKN
ncbi:carbohydrate-binding protein [Lutibacter sp.]|uniref:carbohydrate-binding protein n=1 Tax=Lutibacter sp. TaxID=1925666 RepID=UPI001A317100|nr:carbohydrate-binding protein [Lutibacter sp.]MBI9039908.1 cellulase family glycosylhydrolase [Lutibacter sp.]